MVSYYKGNDIMIRTVSTSDAITADIEIFVKTVLDGIAAADKLSCDYKLELTRNDVAVIAEEYGEIKNIEFS